jgi:hypothetical protein
MNMNRHRETTQAPETPGGIAADTPPAASLPREVVRPASWRGVGVAIATLIVGFAALNVLAGAYLARYTPNLGYWLIERKWALVEAAENPVEWLVLGDSSCNQGLEPNVWSAAFERRPLNLCTIGDMLAVDDVWMLRRLIRRGIVPEKLLVVHAYDSWSRELRPELLGRIPERRTWRADDPAVSLSWHDTAVERLSRHVPLVGQNAALFGVLVNPGSWFEAQFSLTEDGFMSMTEADPQGVENDAEAHLARLRAEPFAMSAANAEALEALGALAAEHGVDVYLVSAPVYEGLAASDEFRMRVERLHARLSEWAAGHERLHYFPEIVRFPSTLMQSTDHVTRDGARVYTRRVAEFVRAAQGAPARP